MRTRERPDEARGETFIPRASKASGQLREAAVIVLKECGFSTTSFIALLNFWSVTIFRSETYCSQRPVEYDALVKNTNVHDSKVAVLLLQ